MRNNVILTLLVLLVIGLPTGSYCADPNKVTILEPTLVASSLEATDGSAYDLDKAESKDPGNGTPKLEIIKQIRRLNSDGSYTVGYEADDGTFKIESRDVLGNVKGTYGYVDVNGEIKRVSYTAGVNSNNSRTTASSDATTTAQPSKLNKTGYATATTRRPSYVTTSQSSSTRATVIQAIPKKRAQLMASSSERPTYNHYASTPRQQEIAPTVAAIRKSGEPTTTIVYATSAPTNRPPIIIRPTALPGGSYKTSEQLVRPDKLEITDHVSKVQISSNRDTSSTKPVTEQIEDKDPSSSEKRSGHGNFVRRQLSRGDQEVEPEAQQQVIYSQSPDDDSSHVYGGSSGTSRPIFNSHPTRIPAAVLSARSRVAQLQNSLNNQAKQQQSDKVYVKPPRRRPESRSEEAIDQSTAEPSSENQYVAQQRPVSVKIVPPVLNRDVQQATEEDKRVYRRPVTFPPQQQPVAAAYRNREFVRQAPPNENDFSAGPRQFRIPIPQAYPHQYQQQPQPPGYPRYVEQTSSQQTEDEIEQQQYLRETSAARPLAATPASFAAGNDPDSEYALQTPRPRGRQYLPYPPAQQRGAEADYEQPSHQVPYPQNPYSPYNRPLLPSQYYQHPDRPLTARDFERLLNLLIVRHQQLQRYQSLPPGVNPYLLGGGFGGGLGGSPYNQFGYQQIPRPPIHNPYDYRRPALYGEFSDQENAYQPPHPSQPAISDQQQHGAYSDNRPINRHRQRAIHPLYPPPEYSEATQIVAQQQDPTANQVEYLPPDIREELLYRMLLLAMQPEEQPHNHIQQLNQQPSNEQGETSNLSQYAAVDQQKTSTSTTSTTSTSKPLAIVGSTTPKFRKPVRSVQILGEDE